MEVPPAHQRRDCAFSDRFRMVPICTGEPRRRDENGRRGHQPHSSTRPLAPSPTRRTNHLSILPVAVVDTRCLNYVIFPRADSVTSVALKYCAVDLTVNGKTTCAEYATSYANSRYSFDFAYSGEQCVSAVHETYAPVHFASLLLTSLGTAAAELVVPGLYAWVIRSGSGSNGPESRLGGAMRCLLDYTFAVPTLHGVWRAPGPGDERSANQAQWVVERAFRNQLGILLVVLTFGLAVPLVGAAAPVSTCVVAVHHAFLLGKLAAHFPQTDDPPRLKGCCDVWRGTVASAAVVVLGVWLAAMYKQFEHDRYAAVASGFGAVVALGRACGSLRWRTTAKAKPRAAARERALYQKLLAESEQDMAPARHEPASEP